MTGSCEQLNERGKSLLFLLIKKNNIFFQTVLVFNIYLIIFGLLVFLRLIGAQKLFS